MNNNDIKKEIEKTKLMKQLFLKHKKLIFKIQKLQRFEGDVIILLRNDRTGEFYEHQGGKEEMIEIIGNFTGQQKLKRWSA